jgi:putative oxidoreductase
MSMPYLTSVVMLIARFCLGLVFLLSGINKFINFQATAAYMASTGIGFTSFFLTVAALIEIIGGLSLILGYKTRWGAALLAFFLIPVTLTMHDFWNVPPAEYQNQMNNFFKNLAVFGGLLYPILFGAGKFSFDACCCCRGRKGTCEVKKPEVKSQESEEKANP